MPLTGQSASYEYMSLIRGEIGVIAEQLRVNHYTKGFGKPVYKWPLCTQFMPKIVLTYYPLWKYFIFLFLHFKEELPHEEGNAFLKKDL